MRSVLAGYLVLVLTLGGSAMPWAADLSGVWVVDQAAWHRQLDGVIAAMLGRMPPTMLAQMRAQGMDPASELRRAASQGLDGTIEFLPDGRVRSVTDAEGAHEDGSWTLRDDTLRVEVQDAEGLEALVGPVAGAPQTPRPILKDPDPGNAFMAELSYPLVRRH
jgi:hypothetical protein